MLTDDEEEPQSEEILKQAVRTGPYSICRKAGLEPLAKKFGLTPQQFAKNLSEEYQIYEVEQEDEEPTIAAIRYTSEKFSNVDEVLKAAQLMVSIQLAREPLVRESVRKVYREKAKITIRPTKQGIKLVDENHPVYTMKYVKDKPVRDLVGDQFLKLAIAEKDKLITIHFSDDIEGITKKDYINHMKTLYYRDEFSKNVQDWNALRVGSVEMALRKMVIPDLKKELYSSLLNEAKESVARACGRKMYNWIKVAPYSIEYPEEAEEAWDTTKGIRVMGLAYVPDYTTAAFACIVGPDGECMDYLKLPHILKRKNSFREDDKTMKEADLLALRNFIDTKNPHVIVVGGESREAIMIAEDLREIVATLQQDEKVEFPPVPVEILDNELSKVYSFSNKGKNQFFSS